MWKTLRVDSQFIAPCSGCINACHSGLQAVDPVKGPRSQGCPRLDDACINLNCIPLIFKLSLLPSMYLRQLCWGFQPNALLGEQRVKTNMEVRITLVAYPPRPASVFSMAFYVVRELLQGGSVTLMLITEPSYRFRPCIGCKSMLKADADFPLTIALEAFAVILTKELVTCTQSESGQCPQRCQLLSIHSS